MTRNAAIAVVVTLLVVGVGLATFAWPSPTSVVVEDWADVGPLPERESFLAFARDFEGFRTWERHAVEGAMIPTDAEPGPTFVYVNHRPPAGTRAWPVGTILVKVIESGAPEDWIVHAMVKRGAPYNHDGTVGWEYFELDLAADDTVAVVWRGQSPPSGHGYGTHGRDAGIDAAILTCNDCHAASWQTDGVLTPALSLLPLPRH